MKTLHTYMEELRKKEGKDLSQSEVKKKIVSDINQKNKELFELEDLYVKSIEFDQVTHVLDKHHY